MMGLTDRPFLVLIFFLPFYASAQAPVINYPSSQVYVFNRAVSPLIPENTGGAVPATIRGQVSTLAGSGVPGASDGKGTSAGFRTPAGLATDKEGNIYVADSNNGLIRKITPDGTVTTFAGSENQGFANGNGINAKFRSPWGLAMHESGDLYVADYGNHQIRKITPSGDVSTFAGSVMAGFNDGIGTLAKFFSPEAIVIDAAGNLYIADSDNNLVRMITPSGIVSTIAGDRSKGRTDGLGPEANFNTPTGLAFDAFGNLIVADYWNNLIRKVTPLGLVTTIAGSGDLGNADGAGVSASFDLPIGLAADLAGNIYLSDSRNNLIRKITTTGIVSTIAGNGEKGSDDGDALSASFYNPVGISIDRLGNLYIADEYNNKIRILTLGGYAIDKALPPGLDIDLKTGIISGKPTGLWPATDYTITAYNSGGSSSAIINIRVIEPDIIFPPIPAKALCDIDFNSGAAANLPLTYTSSNISVATVISGKIHITGTGITEITASNGDSFETQTLTVLEYARPEISITPVAYNTCDGMELTFTASVVNSGINPTYQWQVNGQNKRGITTSIYTSNELRNNDIVTCVVTNNDNCIPLVSAPSNQVIVSSMPYRPISLSIATSHSDPVCPGLSITFIATVTVTQPMPIYRWLLNGQPVGNNNPVFVNDRFNDGDIVSCSVTTDAACIIGSEAKSNAITVKVLSTELCMAQIPNSFSPNGDGINDRWNIDFLKGYPDCVIIVFNRYGNKIYQSVGYQEPWDGTRSGKPLSVATYYYIIDLKREGKKLSGFVHILK